MPDFVIAVPHSALGASVGVTLDTLNIANQVATTLGRRVITWLVIGHGKQVRLTNGLSLDTVPIVPGIRTGRAMLVIPGIGLDHPIAKTFAPHHALGGIAARYDDAVIRRRIEMADAVQLAQLARRHYARGGWVCTSCSGVLIPAMAGLLDGKRATTHWQLSDFMRRHFPRVTVDATRMVVEDGRVVTAGAAMAQMDLMLRLIDMVMGREVADLTMKYMLIDSRPTQARYMVWSRLGGTDDTLRKFESIIESSLPNPTSVSQVARKLHMSEKTLARRVFKATGGSPIQLIQTVRMRHAAHLLDTTDLPVEEVAMRVGYANSTSLRKLTLKFAQLTPAMLRRSAKLPEGRTLPKDSGSSAGSSTRVLDYREARFKDMPFNSFLVQDAKKLKENRHAALKPGAGTARRRGGGIPLRRGR